MTFQEFLAHEKASLDTIDFKRCYVDVADGDLVAGLLLSQIIYYHLPDKEGTRSKLRVRRKRRLWLAKRRYDWWDECRISPSQFDRAIKVLESLEIVITEVHRFDGSPTKHIRLNESVFLQRYEAAIRENGFEGKPKFRKAENGFQGNPKNDIDETRRTIT